MRSKIKRYPSVAAASRETGITRVTLQAWRDSEGVDVLDPVALQKRAGMKQLATADATDQPTDKATVESYHEARRRRAVADADSARIKADIAAGKVIELAEVKETFTRLGSEMKSRLLMMRNNLVNELVGRDEVAVSRILGERINDLLQSIFEDRDFTES